MSTTQSRNYCKIEKCRKWANLDENGICSYHVELQKRDKGNVIFTCKTCSLAVEDKHKSVLCECCNSWFHTACEDVDDETFDLLFKKGSKLSKLRFFCSTCDNKVTEALEKFTLIETQTKSLQQDMSQVKSDLAHIKTFWQKTAKNL